MVTVLESLNAALQRAMAADPRIYLLGEDLLDPYGGAFKVTRGLSTAFPGRVLTTPISEAAIVGMAAGMALRGLRPVAELMFGDFLTLAADQLINHAAKFRWMYNDQVRVPLVVRTPMGGRRGYGPTHSQTLEKHFLGAPGLKVVAPCALGDPGELLVQAIQDDDPVLFVENKLLYLKQVLGPSPAGELEVIPGGGAGDASYRLGLRGAPPPALTLAAYGYMAELAGQALVQLAYQHEIFAELVVLTRLAPFDLTPVLDSAQRTGRLLALEEGTLSLGWGAEVLAQAAAAPGLKLRRLGRLAALDLPVPAAGFLEAGVLPGADQVLQAAKKICAPD